MTDLAYQKIKAGGACSTKSDKDLRIVIDDPELLAKIQALHEDCEVEILVTTKCPAPDVTKPSSKPLGYKVNINYGC